MKILFDLVPVLLFFGAFKLAGIYTAVAVLIVASILQTLGYRAITGRFETTHLVTLGLVTLFGGATLLLHDVAFIKWKPTIIDWLFAAGILGSSIFCDKSLIERFMGDKISLPEKTWGHLTTAWGCFFIVMGAANIFVLYSYDTATWVTFHTFVMSGATLVFIVLQTLYLARYIRVEQPEND